MKNQYGIIPVWQKLEHETHPALAETEIHLWCLPLKLSSIQQEKALTLLSDIQKDRYSRRKTTELKQSYLAGRYYLLNLLSHYTATPANEILLSYSRLNKPSLLDRKSNIEFNFTDTSTLHSQDPTKKSSYGLFAFCKKHSIGVDVESLDRKANFAAISADRFSKEEQQYVADESGGVSPQRCLAIWTRKEAFGKAIGKGINFKMNALNLNSPNNFKLNFTSHNDEWRLIQLQLSDSLISCVAHQSHKNLDVVAFNSAEHII